MWAAFKALIIALVLTPIVRDVFRAYNVVDRPGGRTVHAYPTPRVGGVSIAVAYAAAVLAFFGPKGQLPDYYSEALKLLPGVLVIFLTGLLDDFVNLRPAFKLLGQIAAGAAVFAFGLRIDTVAGFSLPLWLSLLCTVFWLLLSTNALNLIDGLDGLCAGMGFLAAMTLIRRGRDSGSSRTYLYHAAAGRSLARVPLLQFQSGDSFPRGFGRADDRISVGVRRDNLEKQA